MVWAVENFLIYLLLAALGLFGTVFFLSWLGDCWLAFRTKSTKWVCRICGMRFYVPRGVGFHKCPRCKALNDGRKMFRR